MFYNVLVLIVSDFVFNTKLKIDLQDPTLTCMWWAKGEHIKILLTDRLLSGKFWKWKGKSVSNFSEKVIAICLSEEQNPIYIGIRL